MAIERLTGTPGVYVPLSSPRPPIPGLIIKTMMDGRVVKKIRAIEVACLPVRYSDAHYEMIASGIPQFTVVAFYQDIAVGCSTARLEQLNAQNANERPRFRLYIMTICTLEPYRGMGIGSRMLDVILKNVHDEKFAIIDEVHLNVQTSSLAIKFYEKFNFEKVALLENYYSDLDSKAAYSLRLRVPQPFLQEEVKQSS